MGTVYRATHLGLERPVAVKIIKSRPADLAGIKEGDIIIQFDGTPIRTPEELSSRVIRAIPYSTIKVVVMRGTENLEIPVKMGKQ
jgi:S1-C subfamily serine protease